MCSALSSCFAHCWRWVKCPQAGFFGAEGGCCSLTLRRPKKLHWWWWLGAQQLVFLPGKVATGLPLLLRALAGSQDFLAAIGRTLTEWNPLEDLVSLIYFPHMFPHPQTQHLGMQSSPDRYWKSPHKSHATLKSRKVFSDCVRRISHAKPCYSYLKLGKLATSAEFQSHCGGGRVLKR